MEPSMANNFSWFEQYSQMTVDLTAYLSNFSTESYSLKFSNLQPVVTSVMNLFDVYQINLDMAANYSNFGPYTISDGDRPDNLSFNNYKTVEFWWLILLVNGIRDPFMQWPLTQDQLNRLVDQKFASEGLYTWQTYYDMLFGANEAKRSIMMPTPPALYDIIFQLRSAVLNAQV
jgi:hypothetical protein